MVLNIVFFLVSIIILAVIYILLRRRIDKLTDIDRLTNALSGDLDIILAEINQATERNVLIIEDKIKELEVIIETAEKRITLLKKSLPTDTPRTVTTVKPAEKAVSKPVFEKSATPPELFSSGELTYSHLNRITAMSGMVTPLSVPEKNDSESESLQQQVLSLYRNGIDSALIASNVGVNRGEVELIISLYKETNGGLE